MKKAYLVTFSITTRVIAETQEEAEGLAVTKARKNAEEDICLQNWESTAEDIECPVDYDDIEFLLFPNLQSLTEDQLKEAQDAWIKHCEELPPETMEETSKRQLRDRKVLDDYAASGRFPKHTVVEPSNSLLTPDILQAQENIDKAANIWPGTRKANFTTKDISPVQALSPLPDSVTHTLEVSEEGKKESIAPDPLTLEFIRKNKNKVFAHGISDHQFLEGTPAQWAAKVTEGGAGWSIFYGPVQTDVDWIVKFGLPLRGRDLIRHLVNCNDQAFLAYRY